MQVTRAEFSFIWRRILTTVQVRLLVSLLVIGSEAEAQCSEYN